MPLKAHKFVGLSTPVYLPDDIVVEIDIVPASRTNIRSNQPFSGQTSYTQHETANFNAGAGSRMHRNWLHNGASGASVGFNFVVDDKVIIQLTPLNEVTWAAGTAEGNRYSYHTELCVNSDINHVKARRNAAALAGGILAAKGWGTNRLFQHNIWWGKDCPYLLRREGRWTAFVSKVKEFITLAKNGNTPTPTPKPPPTPTPTPVNAPFWMGTAVQLSASHYLREGPGTSHKVATTLRHGTKATVVGGPVTADGHVWWDIKGDFGTGHISQVALTKIADAEPQPVTPTVFDGSKDMVINGITFHADKRSVRVSENTNVRKYADTSSPIVRTVPANSTENVLGWIAGEEVEGIDKWWITRDGRMWSGSTV